MQDRRPALTRTDEQLDFAKRLEALIRPVLGERVRLVPDAEGFPIVPGRMGRLEYLGARTGADRDGERLHVFTDRGRIIPKLLAVPGVHRGQMGDGVLADIRKGGNLNRPAERHDQADVFEGRRVASATRRR